jgi:hypothetical protein
MLHQDYRIHEKDVSLFIPNAYYYEVRNAELYPFPPRHPDTVSILCIWLKKEQNTYGMTFCLNARGYRIVETFHTEIENQVDAWLSHVRSSKGHL